MKEVNSRIHIHTTFPLKDSIKSHWSLFTVNTYCKKNDEKIVLKSFLTLDDTGDLYLLQPIQTTFPHNCPDCRIKCRMRRKLKCPIKWFQENSAAYGKNRRTSIVIWHISIFRYMSGMTLLSNKSNFWMYILKQMSNIKKMEEVSETDVHWNWIIVSIVFNFNILSA